MRENAFCMVFHVRWISHHSSPNPTLVAARLGRDSETRDEKNPSHMENHTKCIIYHMHENLFITLAISLILLWDNENMSDHMKHGINPSLSCSTTFTLGFDITSVIGQ